MFGNNQRIEGKSGAATNASEEIECARVFVFSFVRRIEKDKIDRLREFA